jgi:Domain of Unknown Function (DUF1080)
MKKILTTIAVAGLLTACNNADEEKSKTADAANTPTADSGWVSLFDGKTTAGWHTYGKSSVGEAWKIADGALYLDTTQKLDWQTKGGGDIVTNDEYENFHLKLEWKIAKDGNSGIIFYVHEDTAKYQYVWHTGPEMQVLDNDGHGDGKIIKHRAGDLYDLISCSKETVKPVGEWNEAEIVSNNGKLDFFLNGTNVVSTNMWDSAWKQMLAASKFKDMKDFGTYKKGRIALQDHGNTVWYRNIRIKKL